MEYSLILLSKLTSMMIMAAVGYALVKLRLIKEADSKVLSILLVYALQPCLIFRSLQIELTPERSAGFAAALVFAFSPFPDGTAYTTFFTPDRRNAYLSHPATIVGGCPKAPHPHAPAIRTSTF